MNDNKNLLILVILAIVVVIVVILSISKTVTTVLAYRKNAARLTVSRYQDTGFGYKEKYSFKTVGDRELESLTSAV